MTHICIGTRDSALAIVQARMVEAYINNHTDQRASLLTMKTTGDRILDRPLEQIGGKGLFMKELDVALCEGRSQLNVHSLKDMPMELPEEFPILGVSRREDPRDVLVLPRGVREPDWSKPVGCSGRRRVLQMGRLCPQAVCKSIRGNVLTRLARLDEGEYGALILAAAGLKRLGLEERISRYFEVEEMLPAAGQGVLGVQGRREKDWGFMDGFWSVRTWWEIKAERAYVRALEGGCSSPIAAYAVTEGEELWLRGLYYREDMGKEYHIGSLRGPIEQAEALGAELAERMKQEAQSGNRQAGEG